jgi:TusA-related sulfurtransferase
MLWPLLKVKAEMQFFSESGQVLELHATDRGTLNDFPAWAKNGGHTILRTIQDDKVIKFWVQKK